MKARTMAFGKMTHTLANGLKWNCSHPSIEYGCWENHLGRRGHHAVSPSCKFCHKFRALDGNVKELSISLCPKLQRSQTSDVQHKIIEWLQLERTLNIIELQPPRPPPMDSASTHQIRMTGAPSSHSGVTLWSNLRCLRWMSNYS